MRITVKLWVCTLKSQLNTVIKYSCTPDSEIPLAHVSPARAPAPIIIFFQSVTMTLTTLNSSCQITRGGYRKLPGPGKLPVLADSRSGGKWTPNGSLLILPTVRVVHFLIQCSTCRLRYLATCIETRFYWKLRSCKYFGRSHCKMFVYRTRIAISLYKLPWFIEF